VPKTRLAASLPLAIVLVLIPGIRAGADSALSLPLPELFGEIDANTYDESGKRVGDAVIRVVRLDDGLVELEARSGIEGAEQTVVTAKLEPVGEGMAALRPVHQSSRSFDALGQPLGLMTIDHAGGQVVCAPAAESGEDAQRMELPEEDRVANVPLNLLFLPLVRGEEKRIDFQVVLCRGGPRVLDATAKVAGHGGSNGNGEELVEIRYNLDFGPMLSRLAQPFMPRLSFWFDVESPGAWVGHRMPLFSKGPTVLVVRAGFNPTLLGFD
jgi:hypothetical protein